MLAVPPSPAFSASYTTLSPFRPRDASPGNRIADLGGVAGAPCGIGTHAPSRPEQPLEISRFVSTAGRRHALLQCV